MSLIYLIGSKFNALQGASSVAAGGAGADPNFLESALFDLVPRQSFAFDAAGANDYIDINLNEIVNSDFEGDTIGTPPDNWTTLAGTPTVQAEGNPGNGLSFNSDEESTYIELVVPTGVSYYTTIDLKGSSGAKTIVAFIQNRDTGKYLKNDGTWQSGVIEWATRTTNSYATFTLSFTVETWAQCNYRDNITLRFTIERLGTGTTVTNADNVGLWRQINFCSLHFTNLDPSIGITLRSGADGATFATLQATFTYATPAFYKTIATLQTAQWWRVLFTGTNLNPIRIGELVLGQHRTLARNRAFGDNWGFTQAQEIVAGRFGESFSRIQSNFEQRVLAFPFRDAGVTERDEHRELFSRCQYGVTPIVVVPDSAINDVALVKLSAQWKYVHTTFGIFDTNWDAVEQPGWIEVP